MLTFYENFFIAISHNTIHDPLMEKEALIEKYKKMPESNASENHPVIAAMIETLDKYSQQQLQDYHSKYTTAFSNARQGGHEQTKVATKL